MTRQLSDLQLHLLVWCGLVLLLAVLLLKMAVEHGWKLTGYVASGYIVGICILFSSFYLRILFNRKLSEISEGTLFGKAILYLSLAIIFAYGAFGIISTNFMQIHYLYNGTVLLVSMVGWFFFVYD